MKNVWRYIIAIPIAVFFLAGINALSDYLSGTSGFSAANLAAILGFIGAACLVIIATKYGD